MNSLNQLKESRGLSILLITHNLGVVAEICDRVAVLYVGHVVEKGCTRDIFKEMKHPGSTELGGSKDMGRQAGLRAEHVSTGATRELVVEVGSETE